MVGTLKPSITFGLLPPLPACSPCSQLAPLASSSLPLLPVCSLTPSLLPLLPACPLAPCPHRGAGDPKTYYNIPLPCLGHWEQGQQAGSKGGKVGARGVSLGPTEVVGTPELGPTGGGDPKTYPLISITPYLCSVHWE